MKKGRLRSRQRTHMSAQMKVAIGASIFIAASFLLIIVFNLGGVKDTRAFSSGDYRAVEDGDWSEIESWEIYDGESWTSASMPPGSSVKKVLIAGNTNITITDEIVISNLAIEEGSSLTLDANTIKIFKDKGDGELRCDGKLILGTSIIEGNADLFIGPTATIMIGADAGIDKKCASGNIQLKGKKDFSKEAVYIYNGTVKQNTGNGLPIVLKNLEIDNKFGVELDQSILITDKLILTRGTLYTGKYTISIGASHSAPGEIESLSGAIEGKIRRWYGVANNSKVSFPVSDGVSNNLIIFSANIPEYKLGLIDLIYHEGEMDDSKISPFEIRHVVVGITSLGYYTAFLSNGPDEAWLKIKNSYASQSNSNDIEWEITKSNMVAPIANSSSNEKGSIQKSNDIQNIFCGPTPFQDKLYVRFYSESKTVANIQVMSMDGKMVFNTQVNTSVGYNQFKIDKKNNIPEGSSIMRISSPSEIHTLKIVKES